MRRLWVGAVLGGLALAALGSPADAQERQQGQGTRMEVDAGYDGTYIAGRRLPIFVTVRADRLIRGTIEVSIEDQPGDWAVDVEIAGGGVNDFVVVIPTLTTVELRQIRVRLLGAGEPVQEVAEVDPLEDAELVGLLPEAMPADLPDPLALRADAGTARFVELDNDLLGVQGVLDPIGTVVAGPDELGRLAGDARAAVLDWVDRGGRLVVDAAAGAAIAGLPDEWQPGDAGRAPAGLGEVRAVGGAAAAGRWSEVIEPTPTASYSEMFQLGGVNIMQLESVSDAVARDAGLSSLDLPWLLFFLGGYVALVGPIAWLVLRRGRAALGWVVIPVVAGLFTAGSYVIGSDLRNGTTAAHGTVLETGPAGARATTILGLVSRNGRDGRGEFPAGWIAGAVDPSFWGGGQVQAASTLAVHTGGDGVLATVPLAAGGFGVMRGAGLVDPAGELVVEAHSDGDEVVGSVRNDYPFAVEEVGVMLGRSTERVGRLEPGETGEFSFGGKELTGNQAWMAPEGSLWPSESGNGPQPRFDSVVDLALWNDVHLALGPNARTRGVVTAIGWTRQLDTPAVVAGEGDPVGRSAVVARAPVTSEDGSVAPGAAHREFLRGASSVDLPDDDVGTRVAGGLWRFTLPAGASTDGLTMSIPAYLGRVDVWDGSAWVTLDDRLADFNPQTFNGDISQTREVDLPSALAATGVVWVRGWMLADYGVSDGAGLEVYRA